MFEFNSEFEELVKDLSLSSVDKEFDLIISRSNFDDDINEMNAKIDELYMKCELSNGGVEKMDEVFEKLDPESIRELLKDVYGEEIKGKPVNFLAKQLESKISQSINENRISCASYKTARDELSDYDSVDESDSISDYDSCAESNISSPVVLKSEEDLFKGKKNVFVPQEKVEKNVISQTDRVNETAFRISELEKIEETTITETKIKSNETDFRKRPTILSSPRNSQEKIQRTYETEIQEQRDEKRKNIATLNKPETEIVYRISEKIEEQVIFGKEKGVTENENKNNNYITQTSSDSSNSTTPKRKISNKAIEISESIVGKPLKPSLLSDSPRLPLIAASLVAKTRPDRKSIESLPPKKEFELKLQEIRKKMELRNSQIGSYQSVYSNH